MLINTKELLIEVREKLVKEGVFNKTLPYFAELRQFQGLYFDFIHIRRALNVFKRTKVHEFEATITNLNLQIKFKKAQFNFIGVKTDTEQFIEQVYEILGCKSGLSLSDVLEELKFLESAAACDEFMIEELRSNIPEVRDYLLKRDGYI